MPVNRVPNVAVIMSGGRGRRFWPLSRAARAKQLIRLLDGKTLLEVSDLLDGYIARRYEQVTDFGKLYDPFSDAFTRYTLFLGLYAVGVAQLWMVIAIFYRDAAISFFRTVAATREGVVAARGSGKIKALFQGFGMQFIFLFLVLNKLYPEWHAIRDVPYWIMFVITLVTIASFLDYFRGNLPTLRDAWENRPLRRKKKTKRSPE